MGITTQFVSRLPVLILLLTVPLFLNASDGSKSRFISVDPSLALHLTFDGNLLDASNYGNNGSASNQSYTSDHLGNPNSAYLFNGSNNYVTVANRSTINPLSQVTLTLWLRVDEVQGNYMPIFVKGGPTYGYYNNREYGVWTKQNSALWYPQFKSAGDGSGMHECDSDHHSYNVGQWIFFAFVVDRVNHVMQIYADGALTEEVPDSYSTISANGYPLIIGWSDESLPEHMPLKGAIDDLRIYTYSVGATDIQTLYTGGEIQPGTRIVPITSYTGLICLGIFFVALASWLVKRRQRIAVV